MRYQTYGKLSILAFVLILVSFVILGFSRVVLPYRTARLLAAPTTAIGSVLVVYLFVVAVLSKLGIHRVD